MADEISAARRRKALQRLQAGDEVSDIAADTGISRSTLYRWRRHETRGAESDPLDGEVVGVAAVAAADEPEPEPEPEGKVADITGLGISDHWGVTSTDLGASVLAPNGKLVSVFGDTFSGNRVGEGAWRSPVILIGTGGAHEPIRWERAGGGNPDWAEQLWFYIHDNTEPRWTQGGISTVLPSDLLRVEDALYLHVIVNQGFPKVIWTEIWRSDDSGISWRHLGEQAKFPAALHNNHAQLWSWDYDPDDGWVYVVSTAFRGYTPNLGIILRRVRPEDIGDRTKYSGWGFANGQWGWNNEPTPITPPDEAWGELSFRRLKKDLWILGGLVTSQYALGYRTIVSPVANMHEAPLQIAVTGTAWNAEDHANSLVAQLYGGYVLPGSTLDSAGGVGLVVSQWNTTTGWPYRAMQFRATLQDTTSGPGRAGPDPVDPINL